MVLQSFACPELQFSVILKLIFAGKIAGSFIRKVNVMIDC